jgi:hypothetical protein
VKGKIARGDYDAGVPTRAVFDSAQLVLYYELYRANIPLIGGEVTAYYAYDLADNTQTLLELTEMGSETATPLFAFKDGMACFAANRRVLSEMGIFVAQAKGNYGLSSIPVENDEWLSAFWRASIITDIGGTSVVMLPRWRMMNTLERQLQEKSVVQLVDLSSLAVDYANCFYLLEAQKEKGVLAPADFQALYSEEGASPAITNAALSDDGKYLLLVRDGVYAVNMGTMAYSRVTMDEKFSMENPTDGAYDTAENRLRFPRGIEWLSDGRILLWTEENGTMVLGWQ